MEFCGISSANVGDIWITSDISSDKILSTYRIAMEFIEVKKTGLCDANVLLCSSIQWPTFQLRTQKTQLSMIYIHIASHAIVKSLSFPIYRSYCPSKYNVHPWFQLIHEITYHVFRCRYIPFMIASGAPLQLLLLSILNCSSRWAHLAYSAMIILWLCNHYAYLPKGSCAHKGIH